MIKKRISASKSKPVFFASFCLIGLTLALVMGLLLTPNAHAECAGCQRGAQFDQLFAEAAQKGSVRVLVRLNVERLEELTAASRAYAVVAPGKSFPQSGRDADSVLAAAIAGVADGVINALNNTPFQVTRRFSTLPLIAMEASPDALGVLEGLPQVVSCVPDNPVELPLPIEDRSTTGAPEKLTWDKGTLSLHEPLLNNTTDIIGAETAWGLGYTGAGWYVAVLDTGILNTHGFFTGKDIVEKCYSALNHCPDNTNEDEGPGSAAHHPSTYQGYDHGTHVAGIATGNNGVLFGVAKDADIIAVQVFSRFSDCDSNPATVTPCVKAYDSDILKGLEFVYLSRSSYSIASVNMSLGGGHYGNFCDDLDADYQATKAAIDNLRAVGIATVIATGNNGYCDGVGSPACISSSISVGASYDNDTEAPFNNWHPTLQRFFAPGVAIYSSTGASNASYASWSGTSMATPHVAGAWAILRQADPAASVTDIYQALVSTGRLITTACPSGGRIPRINIDRVIWCDPALLVIDAQLPYPSAFLVPGGQVTLNAYVSDHCGGFLYDLTVQAAFSNGDAPVRLYDDGLHDDGVADDGIYGNWWMPLHEQDPATITYSAAKTGYTPDTDQVVVSVVYDYCPAEALSSAYEHIANVTFAGINNDSTEEGGYSDYTAGVPATVLPGENATLAVTISPDSSGKPFEFLSVFIDWNRNRILDDPGERYDLAAATSLTGPFTTLVSVPADAPLGDRRMRVVLEWATTEPEACGTFDFGEVEDYTVSVICEPFVLSIAAQAPETGAFLASGSPTLIEAQVTDQCAGPVFGATVEAGFSNGDAAVQLYDDGLHDDGAADDGHYAAWWTPVTEQDPTVITFSASKTACTPDTDQVSVAIVPDYCATGGLDAADEYITNVAFAGINNDSTQSGGYSDYTAGTAGNVLPGTSANLSVSIDPDANDFLSAFIDWNQNLVFDDPAERFDLAGPTDQAGPFTQLLTVPADAVPGDTRLRVVLTRDGAAAPCGAFADGEAEDYSVHVGCNPGRLGIEVFSPTPATVLPLGDQTVLKAGVADQCGGPVGGVSVEATFSNGQDPVMLFDDGLHADNAADDGIFGNWWIPVNQQDPTTITFTASKNGYFPAVDQVDVTVGADYCAARGTDSSYDYITNVTFAGIINNSTSEGGYSDYTAGVPANVTPGTDEPLSVTIQPMIFENLSVFIDWNRNAVFDDPAERQDLAFWSSLNPGPFTTSISVPPDAAPGNTRMRVILTMDAATFPCGMFVYGEVEDYTVQVNPLAATLDLVAGWNLISLPLSPLETAIETVLSPISGKYISAWSFSAGVWKLYDPANPGFSDLSDMNAGIGYWINMSQAATLPISGTTPDGYIPVFNGWNLVGYNAGQVRDTAAAMTSLAGKYISVWAYINGGWKLYDPANPGFSDLLTIDPGLGYWINASSDGTWTM